MGSLVDELQRREAVARAEAERLRGQIAEFLAVLGVLERNLALIPRDRDRVQAEPPVIGQLGRHLVLRAPLLVQVADDLGPAAHLALQRPHVSEQVVDVFRLVAGPVPVRNPGDGLEVTGALEVVGVDLDPMSRAQISSSSRSRNVLPIRGIDPMMTEANISVRVTDRPRGSVPNTTGANTSACPRLASGQAGCSAVVMSWSATYRASAPGCRL